MSRKEPLRIKQDWSKNNNPYGSSKMYESSIANAFNFSKLFNRRIRFLQEKHLWKENLDDDEDDNTDEEEFEDTIEVSKTGNSVEGGKEWIKGEQNIIDHIKGWIARTFKTELDITTDSDGIERSKVDKRSATRTDPFHGFDWKTSSRWKHRWDGGRDKNGRFHGKGVVSLMSGAEIVGTWIAGRREGRCSTVSPDHGIAMLVGNYRNNKLTGRGKMVKENGATVEGFFRDGCLHGLAREIDEGRNLVWIGRYKNGRKDGICWNFLKGGGFLVGPVDRKGTMTGEGMMYIFPDLTTCLVGYFDKGVMLRARAAVVTQVVLCKGVMEVSSTEPLGQGCRREVSSPTSLCGFPTARDVYESRMIECRTSRMGGAGEGVFMKRSVPAGTIVAFYNGVVVEDDCGKTWEECSYRIFLGEKCLDIPPEMRDVKSYCATLAHKMNHSFKPNCKFGEIEHPRFGHIPTIVTSEPVDKDQELYVYYHYRLDDCPEWYSSLWEQGQ